MRTEIIKEQSINTWTTKKELIKFLETQENDDIMLTLTMSNLEIKLFVNWKKELELVPNMVWDREITNKEAEQVYYLNKNK